MALPEQEVEESLAALDNMVKELQAENPEWRLGQTYYNALFHYGVDPQFAIEIRTTPLDPYREDSRVEAMREALRAWWGEDKPPNG